MYRALAGRARRAAAGCLALALSACAGGDRRVGPEALESREHGPDAPLVVDVRSRAEFDAGHVPGAVHLPFQSTWSGRETLPPARDTPIVVYCEHGPRAALARLGLESIGYRNVVSLRGHMAAWREAGLPVEPD